MRLKFVVFWGIFYLIGMFGLIVFDGLFPQLGIDGGDIDRTFIAAGILALGFTRVED